MRKILCGVLCIFLVGCKKQANFDGATDGDLYRAFNTYMMQERYTDALSVGQAIVQAYPASEFIEEVREGVLIAHVKNHHYDVALQYADRLLDSNLLNAHSAERIKYQKIMTKVQWSQHWMAARFSWLGVKDKYRNVDMLGSAVSDMESFISSYPDSEHMDEIKMYCEEVKAFLARHELDVALHYAKQGNFKAAKARVNRCQELYPNADIREQLISLRQYPGIELTTGMVGDLVS